MAGDDGAEANRIPPSTHEIDEGEDLFNDDLIDDCRKMRIDDSLDDEMDSDRIMADRRAKGACASQPKLPQILHDQDSRDDIPMTDETDDDPYFVAEYDEDEDEYAMYRVKGPLREWVTRDEVRRFIGEKCMEFLLTCVDPKSENKYIKYTKQINEMVSVNKCSFEIDYLQFLFMHSKIAIWLVDAPHPVLEAMEQVVNELVFTGYPNYRKIHPRIYVRITNFPVYDNIRNIRQKKHLNTMIRIGGIVTQRSGVFPQLLQVKYGCNKCGAILGPIVQNSFNSQMIKDSSCPKCHYSNASFTVNIEQTIYRNYQKLNLEESPQHVPAGRPPRCMEVILLNDLIDCALPGEEIEVTGICSKFDVSLTTKNGFPVSAMVVEANYVAKQQHPK